MDAAEKEKRRLVEQSCFFKGFDKEIIDGILPLMTECRFNAENAICLKGDDSDSLYLISEGMVEISVSSKDGKVIVLGMMGKGDVFGEIGLLDNGSRTADVTAKSDMILYRLSGRDFTEMTKKFSLNEWQAVTTYVCDLFRRVTNNLEEAAFLDTNVRVIKKILDIYKRSPEAEKGRGAFKLNLSQEMLGRMVGLSREATNKTLSRLAEEGLIESKYKHIMVPRIEVLRGMIEREEE
jgi:CRP/FNR family cyclic AMP-dependent transcriptional regulator